LVVRVGSSGNCTTETTRWSIWTPNFACATVWTSRTSCFGDLAPSETMWTSEMRPLGVVTTRAARTSGREANSASRIPGSDRRVWLLLQAVLVSAFGLMILVYRQIGWPAVAAMLVLLALTKGEFDRYSQARRTLTQTMSALAELEAVSLP